MCQNCGWSDFVDNCTEVLDEIDDLPPKAADFGEEVGEKIRGMMAWSHDNRHVTKKMEGALNNIHRGIKKWTRR